MATYTWSVPSGKEINGSTKIKDTDNKIADTINNLVDFVNSEGDHAGQGLAYDLVDKASSQTITGDKIFSGLLTGTLTGNASSSSSCSGNSATATLLSAGADRTKLDGIETGATADQSASEIKALYESQSNTNAYTDAEKTKLSGIATGAEVNVKSDWNASSGDAQILNKPSTVNYGTQLMHIREGYFHGSYNPTLNGTFGISNYTDYNWFVSMTSTQVGYEHDYNKTTGHSPYGGFDFSNVWDNDDSEYHYAYVSGNTVYLEAIHRNSTASRTLIGRYHLVGVLKTLSSYAQVNE